MVEPETVLSYTLAFMGVMIFFTSALFYRHLTMNSDRAMAAFQLRPEETVQNFRLLYYGAILETGAFIIYSIGGLLELSLLLNIGRIISGVFLGVSFLVAVRWWRRFS